MNCDNCEHFISPDTCAWGKNPKTCGRNFPTLEDVYVYQATHHMCCECKHYAKVGGHGSTEYGTCPHREYPVWDDSTTCEHFEK